MSIYECSITNPKKQLEFYKILSEQLQTENQQLKNDNAVMKANLIQIHDERLEQLELILKEIREYINELPFNDLVPLEVKVIKKIIDKGVNNEETNR